MLTQVVATLHIIYSAMLCMAHLVNVSVHILFYM